MAGHGSAPSSDFNQEAFFAAIAGDLHTSGAMKTYDKPHGQAENWPYYTKKGHPEDSGKNKPGLVRHSGDEPYSTLTNNEITYHKEITITADHLKLKSGSVVKAIRQYMPPEKFDKYLTYFTANIDKPSHKAALDKAFDNIREQLATDKEKVPLKDIDALIAKGGSSNDLREKLPESTLTFELTERPELMLSIAIYQAAHMTYVDQLKVAIAEHKDITPDERDNANYVLDGPFKQFKTSLLFASLAPMIARERVQLGQKMAKGEIPAQPEDELVRQSITAGWKSFFEADLLTRDYPEKQIAAKSDGSPATLTCPAVAHLKGSMNLGSLERVYDYVTGHRKELADQLNGVDKVTRGAAGVASQQGWANFI